MTGEVSPLGHGDEVASPDDLRASRDDLRASHEDRDRVAELLRMAAGDGRLTAEELDERLEKALTARTYGELAALSRDLPAAPGLAAGAAGLTPKDMIRIERTSGWAKREGGPVEEIRPGDVVWFAPGERHWHGAAPTTAMTHIAIQEKLNGKVVDWMEKVSDEEYRK